MRRRSRIILGCVTLLVCALAVGAPGFGLREPGAVSEAAPRPPMPRRIVVRGRLEPRDGVFQVAAFSLAPTASVGEILVAEGQAVRKGDVVANLRSHDQALRGVEAAKASLAVAERKLDLTRRPYKDSLIAAQEAAVQARQADLSLAQAQIHRSQLLRERGVVSEETSDTRAAEVSRARANLEEARARLQAATEVPTREVRLAEAEVDAARAKLAIAQEELALTEIRAPTDGVVMKVHAKSGELVSNRPLMDIGNFDQPKIVAEVDERLVSRLRIGQRVEASLPGNDESWHGTITRIGAMVISEDRPAADSVTDRGGRIVEVVAPVAEPVGLPLVSGLELIVRIDAP